MLDDKVLMTPAIDLDELGEVPAQHRVDAFIGQLAAYFAAATTRLGMTLEDIQAVGRCFAAAGILREGATIVFVDDVLGLPCDVTDPVHGMTEPAVTDVEELGPSMKLMLVSAAAGLTSAALAFPVRVSDILPIYQKPFKAQVFGPSANTGNDIVTRVQLTFHVNGKPVVCSNLGTGDERIFKIVQT